MRYIDNSHRNRREDTLLSWLQDVLTEDVIGIQWQSGFFREGILSVFSQTFERLARENLNAVILIGSNDGETQADAVRELVRVLRLPRANALLGVVRYAAGFYHPKTIHLHYYSGRQVAYVGSSNLTPSGISGRNVEAGLILDTDEGDPVDVLDRIKSATREWFESNPEELFRVKCEDDVNQLQERGILTIERPARLGGGEGNQLGGALVSRRGEVLYPLASLLDRGDVGDGAHDDPTEEPHVDDYVLIAELVGPGRWSQSAFPQRYIDEFFQVQPNTDDVLRLLPVTEENGVGEEGHVVCGYKGSRNWYYELGLAARIGRYPRPPLKPIGVFHRIAYQTCRYTILMPNDAAYQIVADCLSDNLSNRRGNELPRVIVSAQILQNAWPDNWFFRDLVA